MKKWYNDINIEWNKISINSRRCVEIQKAKIEKNTVQETLLVPLYGRKMCSEKFPELYTDIFAKNLCDSLDYDFSELERKNNSFLYEFGSLEAAMRLFLCLSYQDLQEMPLMFFLHLR